MPMMPELQQHFNEASKLFIKSPAAGLKKLMEREEADYAAQRGAFLSEQFSNPHLARGIIYSCAVYPENHPDASTGYLLAMAYDAIGYKKEALTGYRKAADHGFSEAKKAAEKIDFSHVIEILIPKMLQKAGIKDSEQENYMKEWRQAFADYLSPSFVGRLFGKSARPLPESLRQLRLTEKHDDLFMANFYKPLSIHIESVPGTPIVAEQISVNAASHVERVRSRSSSRISTPEILASGESTPTHSFVSAAIKPASVIQEHFQR